MCPRAARCGAIRWSLYAPGRAQGVGLQAPGSGLMAQGLRLMLAYGLWKEPARGPAAGSSCVQQPFVKAPRTSIPKLDRVRDETKAAPERRSRYGRSGEALLRIANASLEQLARGEPFTLL